MKERHRSFTLAGVAAVTAALIVLSCVPVSANECLADSLFCPLSIQENSLPVTATVSGDLTKGMVMYGPAKAPIPRVNSSVISTLINRYQSQTHTVPSFAVPQMKTSGISNEGVYYYWAPCN